MPAKKIMPVEEIEFTAKIGFLTKPLWIEFFGRGTPRWRNRCWLRLSQSGLFIRHRIMPDVLVLNPRHGFVDKLVNSRSRPPHVNQIFHDEIVGRSALTLKRAVNEASVAIEAELKKAQPLGNKGKKVSQHVKHPDLLIAQPSGRKVAIEVELNLKSKERYKVALRAYRSKPVAAIVFVIRSAATKTAILRAANEVRFPLQDIPIGFCSLYEWQANPLDAKVFIDKSSVQFGSLLNQMRTSPEECP